MSKTQATTLHLVYIVGGLSLLLIAMYQGWSLVQMIEDQMEYASKLSLPIITGSNEITVHGRPLERFLGAGLIGMFTPAIAGLLSGHLLTEGIGWFYAQANQD